MEVIKKINNNVAICIDSDGNELVAFGKGIGFPTTPYLLDDLSKITMTFYQVDYYYYNILNNLPADIIDMSVSIVKYAQEFLDTILNPNLVFILADHFNFAIYRLEKYGRYDQVYSFEIEQSYPREAELAKVILNKINHEKGIKLPKSEVTNLTMHFVNSRLENDSDSSVVSNEDRMIEEIANIISDYFSIDIRENTYFFHRLVLHLRSYLYRLESSEQFKENNSELIDLLKIQYPEIYHCAKIISEYILTEKNVSSSDDEVLYLMLHIRRVISNEEENS